jgi:hypothetical protein
MTRQCFKCHATKYLMRVNSWIYRTNLICPDICEECNNIAIRACLKNVYQDYDTFYRCYYDEQYVSYLIQMSESIHKAKHDT